MAPRSTTHFLVAAEYGIVPFHGRAEELAEWGDWCAGEAGLELGVLLGGGGSGKTRLAGEVCRHAQKRGAMAGFLLDDVSADAIALLGEVSAPLLVVVDEAHRRLDEVVTLLRNLARVPSDAPRRVLLLARRAGEWWEISLRRRLGGDPDADYAYSTAMVRELGAVDTGVAARERAFHHAARAFAARIERDAAGLSVPDLARDVFAQVCSSGCAVSVRGRAWHGPTRRGQG